MAFEKSTSARSKNQFAARIVSNKVQENGNRNMICWAHVTDDTARKVFGVSSVAEITYAAAAEKLPMLLDNDRTSVVVSDMFADLTPVAIDDY